MCENMELLVVVVVVFIDNERLVQNCSKSTASMAFAMEMMEWLHFCIGI